MPLDPILKAFLDQLEAQPTPKMWEMPPAMAREAMVAMMQFAGPQNVPIGSVSDIAIPGPAGDIPARVYTPVGVAKERLPALAFFHGGGFVIGSIETHDGLCRMLANMSGCRIVSVEYRLAPEHPFPAAVEDAFAATSWVAKNAAQLAIDADRLAVGGDSAGGNLAAVVTQMARDAGAPRLAFQMLLFPATDLGAHTASRRDFAEGYLLDMKTMQWFSNHYLGANGDVKNPHASPLLADKFTDLPPAFVMVAGFDPLHDEGIAYAEKLREAGVAVAVAEYPHMVHDFIYLVGVLPQASEALGAAANALKDALIAE
jgi:acetyl esterase